MIVSETYLTSFIVGVLNGTPHKRTLSDLITVAATYNSTLKLLMRSLLANLSGLATFLHSGGRREE